MRGRPKLYASRRTLTLILSTDDYNALRSRAQHIAEDKPGFSMADLVREFVERGLAKNVPAPQPIDVHTARVRQLYAISRSALELAKALKTA
jgi:hypothetical protein